MTRSCVPLVFVLCSVAACGGSSQAVGVYHFDTAAFREVMLAKGKEAAPELRQKQLEAIDGMVAAMRGRIELKADGTATLQIVMMNKSNEATGTWRLLGSTLAIDGVASNGARETKTLQWADGVITMEQKGGSDPVQLVFRRQ